MNDIHWITCPHILKPEQEWANPDTLHVKLSNDGGIRLLLCETCSGMVESNILWRIVKQAVKETSVGA